MNLLLNRAILLNTSPIMPLINRSLYEFYPIIPPPIQLIKKSKI